ncbi:MAG: lamin tail domain-containing protein [Bacteroidota bacterium]
MKNFKYLLVMLIALTTTISCVDDEMILVEGPEIEGSVLKLNEIMSKDVNDAPDWIEVYNSGTEDMDISGYWLNDKPTAEGGFQIPDGTIIRAGGFYVVDSDESGESVSSGGEDVSLSEPDGTVIDWTVTPDMSKDVGLTWAREIDGEGEWMVGSPTKGSSNGSAENTAPIIGASPLTELDEVYEVTVSDADGIASVKLVMLVNGGVQSIDMALVGDEYKTSVPTGEVGDEVKYYVVAKDNTGLTSYYPEGAPDELGSYYITGGSPLFVEVTIDGIVQGYTNDLIFNANIVDINGIEEVKLYYIFPGQTADDKENIALTEVNANGIYQFTIPATEINGQQLRYYLRAESVLGEKTYYPSEDDGTFDHDDATTWPIVYEPEVSKEVTTTEGPLTKLIFVENPVPGNDINVTMEFSTTDVIAEARIYFDVGDSPEYVKDNKVKGENDGSFTQTGVTVNLKDEEAVNELIIGDSGNKTSFYVRIATQDAEGNELAEYYYSNDGTMILDDLADDTDDVNSDNFKDDASLWNSFTVQ